MIRQTSALFPHRDKKCYNKENKEKEEEHLLAYVPGVAAAC